jgi:hypothetical protein
MDDEGILLRDQMEMSNRLLGLQDRTTLCNVANDMVEVCSCPPVLWMSEVKAVRQEMLQNISPNTE